MLHIVRLIIVYQSTRDFDTFIRDCDLIDPSLLSVSFTWSNFQKNLVCNRLDRLLFSLGWEESFPSVRQKVLPRVLCNHCPLVMESNPLKWGPTPFRFENMWLDDPSSKMNFKQ